MAEQHFVIGTAGHIDHGKTSLIRALTGVDLDRLPEEQARGITIALGFTHLELSSGRTASFVDVPGHERLVRTMIAGASGLHAVMLCVSAVEGVMPQTREHLAILELLGLQRGLVALTMTDLVDEEMLELAMLDVEEAIQGTFLEDAPVLPTAAGPQPRGIDALREALDALVVEQSPRPGPFRLPIDRAFVRKGFGTVVTGTARAGLLTDGVEVEVLPEGLSARVRGIQVHGHDAPEAVPGRRTALNLAGVERDDLARGMVVVERGSLVAASILDVRLRHLARAPELADGTKVRLLLDTAEVMAVLTVLDDVALRPGQTHLAQLRTDQPIVALAGDRFVIRRESPMETLGGGVVLDPFSRRLRRRNAEAAVAELLALEAGDLSVLLARAGEGGLTESEARLRGVEGLGLRKGERFYDPALVARWEDQLVEGLGAWHGANPLVSGCPRRDLHRTMLPRLEERAFDELIAGLVADGRIEAAGPRIRVPGFEVAMLPEVRARYVRIEAGVKAAGFEGPHAGELLKVEPELTLLLIERERLVKVSDKLLHIDALSELQGKVRAYLEAHGEMSAPEFKEVSGLTRKHAIPLLEWLDRSGLTRREGDKRVLRT